MHILKNSRKSFFKLLKGVRNLWMAPYLPLTKLNDCVNMEKPFYFDYKESVPPQYKILLILRGNERQTTIPN